MGWWETAKPGDFVVCVAGVPFPRDGADPVVKGAVYQIKKIYVVSVEYADAGNAALHLADHNNGRDGLGNEGGWRPERFRPVKPLHTSLIDSLHAPVSPWGVPERQRVS